MRTRFIIDTSDNGYGYYKNRVDEWMKSYGYKRKSYGHSLKYHKDGFIQTFALDYHQEENNMVIEAWVELLGREESVIQIKNYTDLLSTLLTIEGKMEDENKATLLPEADYSKVEALKEGKRETSSLVFKIVGIGAILALIIELLH